jgi:hypothetical protein
VNQSGRVARETTLTIAAAMIGAGWMLVVLLVALGPGLNAFFGGLMFGTLFGHVSLAAAWTSLGPLKLIVRLPLAAAWLAALPLALSLGALRGPMELEFLVVVGGAIVGQWILVQIPLWLLVWFYRLRIVAAGELPTFSPSDQQFGIRQLMILTAIVAVVLGLARMLLGGISRETAGPGWVEGAKVFGIIAVANTFITLPMLGAVLLPRLSSVAIVFAGLFAVAVALVEYSVFRFVVRGGGSAGDLILIFGTMNVVQCSWVVALVTALRLGGYRLLSATTSPPDPQ